MLLEKTMMQEAKNIVMYQIKRNIPQCVTLPILKQFLLNLFAFPNIFLCVF